MVYTVSDLEKARWALQDAETELEFAQRNFEQKSAAIKIQIEKHFVKDRKDRKEKLLAEWAKEDMPRRTIVKQLFQLETILREKYAGHTGPYGEETFVEGQITVCLSHNVNNFTVIKIEAIPFGEIAHLSGGINPTNIEYAFESAYENLHFAPFGKRND